MAVTNFTPLLGLALPTTGDLSGTWGATVNTAITDLLDDAVAGTVTLSTDVDVTLTTTNGADNQARNAVILCSGARTGIKTITAPAQSKAYIIINATSGGFGVKIVGAGPSTPGVTVPNGEKALVAWNGSDFVQITSSVIDLTSEVTGTLPIANGGTGTATPALVQGSNITITGSWPNQTIAASGAGQVYPGVGIANSTGSAWGTSYTTTGTGTVVALATSPTFVTPLLGTPTSGNLTTCTADGTNKVGYLNIPNSGAKTTSYTLVIGDVGKFIELGAGGSVVVPASIFSAGDAISIFNNTGSSISCTCSAVTTVYKGGTDADISSFSVTTRGVATILFITATVAVVTGNLA